MLSPSLHYVHRFYTFHGVYFGDFGHGHRLVRQDYIQLIIAFAFFSCPLFSFISGLINGPSLPVNSRSNLVEVVGNIKPVTKFIFNIVFASYWFSRLVMYSVITFKGIVILNTINNPLYRRFDFEIHFCKKIMFVLEISALTFLAYQLISIWETYGLDSDLVSLVMIINMYFNCRHHVLSYILQFYIFHANRFWLLRLLAVAKRKTNSTLTLIKITQQAERLLCDLNNIYNLISPIVLFEILGVFGLFLFLGIYILIRPLSLSMFYLFGGNAILLGIIYVAIFWQHFLIVNRFETLQALLSKQTFQRLSSGSKSCQRSMQTNLEAQVFLLLISVRHRLPPVLCGLLCLRLGDLGKIIVFLIETSIILYQTEYM